MRHNHTKYVGSLCKSVFDLLLNWKNQKSTSVTKIQKNKAIFLAKTRKPDAKTENPETATDSKTEKQGFSVQRPKNRPKKWPKPKIPTPPSLTNSDSNSIVSLSLGLPVSYFPYSTLLPDVTIGDSSFLRRNLHVPGIFSFNEWACAGKVRVQKNH